MSVLRPFAAAVLVTGTACMISAGSAEYATAVPAETTVAPTTIAATLLLVNRRTTYAAAITTDATAIVNRGPGAAETRADTGERNPIATPPGTSHKPLTPMDAPSSEPVHFGSR